MKSEFTAVVSHELRTPLTSIRGSLGLILGAMSRSLPPKVRDLLEIAQSNCERLVLLVNDILDIEKFAAGQMRFEIADRAARRHRDAGGRGERRLRAQIPGAASSSRPFDPAWSVRWIPTASSRCLSNLLSNAAKYSPAGGTVRVWSERRDEFVRISVRDTGPGIPGGVPRAHLRKIFAGRFFGDPRKRRHRTRSAYRPALHRADAWAHRLRFRARHGLDLLGGAASQAARRLTTAPHAKIGNSGLARFPAHAVRLLCGGAGRTDHANKTVSPWPRWRAYVIAVVLTLAATACARSPSRGWATGRSC